MKKEKGLEEKELLESFCLCNVKGIGAASIKKLIACGKTAEQTLNLPEETVKALLGERRAELFFRGTEKEQRSRLQERYLNMKEKKIFFLPFWHEEYPERLLRIPDAPAALYGIGNLPREERRAVAIIGTRACSGYGREVAQYFASGLAKEGVVVISGMARGVDGIAGEAALEAGGYSAAVLGCSVDICYPPENRKLYERLCAEGCLLSEYPPQTEPDARLFPPRNRIISGLADLVLVIEAREKSGTLITVDMALEQGKDVFAVPGRITDRCSRGCNRLIGSGAGIAVSVAQLMDELGTVKPAGLSRQEAFAEAALSVSKKAPAMHGPKAMADRAAEGDREEQVLAALDCNPKSLDEIFEIVRVGMKQVKVGDVMEVLMRLCAAKRAGSCAGLFYRVQNNLPDF